MFGKATLSIPKSRILGRYRRLSGLPDWLAMFIGRCAAKLLSEREGFVTVELKSGTTMVIGYCTVRKALTIGRLTYRSR